MKIDMKAGLGRRMVAHVMTWDCNVLASHEQAR
jgi:hypothetical protein